MTKFETLLSESLPFRLARTLCAAWPGSLAGRALRAVADFAESSLLVRGWRALMDRESRVGASVYDRAVGALHRTVRRFGLAVRQSASVSVAARVGAVIAKPFAGSRILGALRAFGLRRILICAFVLYLPLDVLIRDVIGIAALSSLWDEAFLLLCFAYAAWRRAFGDAPLRTATTPLDAPLLLYIALGVLLCCTVGESFSVALAGWRAVFQYMFWFFALLRLFERDEDLDCFFNTAALLIVALALHGIYQYIIGVEMPASWTTSTEVGVRTRVFSITTSCNIFGCLLVMCAPLVVSYAFTLRRLWQKALVWAGAMAVCLALLFTFSRGAWLGMVAAVLLFSLLTDRRILAVMLACVPAVLLVPSVSNRLLFLFTSDYQRASNVAGRSQRWAFGWELFRENLLGGFGLGRFGGAVAMQNQTITAPNFTYFYLDNYYLKTMTEEGLFGILCFAAALLAILLFGLRAHARAGHPHSKNAVRIAALLSGLVGVMVHMYTENILEVPYMNAYFWGFAAALAYLGFVRGKKTDLLQKK